MTFEMTRKGFLKTVTGAAAGLAASAIVPTSLGAAAPGVSAGVAPAAKSKVKLGASVYSYNGDFLMGTMNLEDCIADIADMGSDGVEILGEAHVPNYPNPPDKWVEQWFGWMEKYHTKPTAYDLFLDARMYRGRVMTVQEAVDSLVRDFKLAHRLGFKVLRAQNSIALAFGAGTDAAALYGMAATAVPEGKQVVEKALPYAEQYDVKMAFELHSPALLRGGWVDPMLEFVNRTKTKYVGFCPDMSIFTMRPPESTVKGLIQQGARENIVNHIITAWQNDLGPDKTIAEVKKMGGNEVELRYASVAGIYHSSHNDPKDIVKLIPYMYHIHAKVHEMTEDLREPGINYQDVVPILARGGYDNYWSTEWEGNRDIFEASIGIRRQHLMIRKLWEAA